jgi:hypothetical protein
MEGVIMQGWRLLFLALGFVGTGASAQDYSGVYDCVGMDYNEGEFVGTVTMTLEESHSNDDYQSYTFILEVPDFGVYNGFAAAKGEHAGIYFALDDKANEDYGVSTARFFTDSEGRINFHKFYFEPNYKGGNTGTEDCVMVTSLANKVADKE